MEKMLNPLHDNFIGHYVEVLCKMKMMLDVETEVPLAFQGYFITYDENNYYFGDNPIEIKKCVQRELVGFMEKIEPRTMEEEILDSMDEPEDESDFN